MPPGRKQAVCLTANAFRVERLVQHLLTSRIKSRRLFSTARSLSNSTAPASTTKRADVATLSEKKRANAQGLDVLKEMLARLRLKNRGIDSHVIRKVNKPKSNLENKPTSVAQLPKKSKPPQNRNHEKLSYTSTRSTRVLLHEFPVVEKSSRSIPLETYQISFVDDAEVNSTELQNDTPNRNSKTSKSRVRKYIPRRAFLELKPVFAHLRGVPPNLRPTRSLGGIMRYQGYDVEPNIDLPAEIATPWLSEATKMLKDQALLNQEIKEFEQYIMPTKTESAAKVEVAKQVQKIIGTISQQKVESELFGSSSGGYALSHADIDVRVFLPKNKLLEAAPRRHEMTAIVNLFPSLQGAFLANGFINSSIHNSRYPLIDMVHEETGISVQVVASNSAIPAKTYLQSNLARKPEIVSIYALIRTMMKLRNLTDVYYGGLNSYPLLIMIIASVKLYPGATAAENLANFLEFYGTLNSKTQMIGLVPPMLHPKLPQKPKMPADPSILDQWVYAKRKMGTKNQNLPFLLTLQDPVDKNNDLGRKAYTWYHIKKTFQSNLQAIQRALEFSAIRKQQQGSILLPLIGGSEEYFGPARKKVQAYGEKVLAGQTSWSYVNSLDEHAQKKVDRLVQNIENRNAMIDSLQGEDSDLLEESSELLKDLDEGARWEETDELAPDVVVDEPIPEGLEPNLREAELSLYQEDLESESRTVENDPTTDDDTITEDEKSSEAEDHEQDIDALRKKVEKGNLF